jgi:WD40 repeat protein
VTSLLWYSPTLLVTGAADDAVRLWHLPGPVLPGTDIVNALAFSPDGRTLAAAGADGAIHTWNTDPELTATAVCATAGTPLTRAEWQQYIRDLPYRPPC